MMDDWHESVAKAECLDLWLRLRRLEAEFAALEAENERLRADKARLDWLNDNANPAIYCPSDSGAFSLKWSHATNGRVPTLRDAIDLELDDEIAADTYTAAMQLMDGLK